MFWAEQRVPSGIAAVVLATIPVFITLMEIIFLRTQRLTIRLGFALLLGLCGVAVLMNHSFSLTEVPINRAGAIALLVASITWSIATIFTRRLPLPASKPMSAAAQMLTGGALLFVLTALTGEFEGFRVQAVSGHAWFALVYLIIAGSIVGFTAYVWLLHYESPTKVGNVRICESGGGGRLRIFSRRRSSWAANAIRDLAGLGERDHDYDYAEARIARQNEERH